MAHPTIAVRNGPTMTHSGHPWASGTEAGRALPQLLLRAARHGA